MIFGDLNPEQEEKIISLLREAQEKSSIGDLEQSKSLTLAAIQSLPNPKYHWSMSYVIVDAAVRNLIAIECFEDAMTLLGEFVANRQDKLEEDFVWFMYGVIFFETGDFLQSHSNFKKSNAISKGRCFSGENKKYKLFFNSFKKTIH